MITKGFLLGLKRRALRRGLWYRVLDSLDRGYYDLTCYVVDRIRSVNVFREILVIVLKLREALKGKFVRLVESLGVMRAWNDSEIALLWGNGEARGWRRDSGFARFHAVLEFNSPSGL